MAMEPALGSGRRGSAVDWPDDAGRSDARWWRMNRFAEETMSERFVTRGFVGRRGTAETGRPSGASRTPPGQYLTTDFPVLSAGPTPRTPLDRWSFSIEGLVREPITWTWDEFQALPARDWTVDISCVTWRLWAAAIGGAACMSAAR